MSKSVPRPSSFFDQCPEFHSSAKVSDVRNNVRVHSYERLISDLNAGEEPWLIGDKNASLKTRTVLWIGI